MRQIEGHPLWLGHVGDARDLRHLLAVGVRAVVDLAANEPPVTVTRELAYCRFPLIDGAGNEPWLVRAAVACVAGLLREGVATFVYCSAGMSRTPVVAAAALARVRACTLSEALAVVTAGAPADVSPALLAEVSAID